MTESHHPGDPVPSRRPAVYRVRGGRLGRVGGPVFHAVDWRQAAWDTTSSFWVKHLHIIDYTTLFHRTRGDSGRPVAGRRMESPLNRRETGPAGGG